MAELLVREGYVVLFPDSFRPRGREEICTIENRQRTITMTARRLDAQGALAYLQSRPEVAPDRIALLGWSHGGEHAAGDLQRASIAPSPHGRSARVRRRIFAPASLSTRDASIRCAHGTGTRWPHR